MSEKLAVLGVGNILEGDDGAGPYIARKLAEREIPSYDCGTAPENFTGVVRNLQPETLVIIDASLMGLFPGSIRRIPPKRIKDVAIGTHMLPLSCIAEYLSKSAGKTVILGIQPETLNQGDRLSRTVQSAADSLVETIAADKIDSISLL